MEELIMSMDWKKIVLYLLLRLSTKGTHRVRSERECRASFLLLMESVLTFPALHCVHQLESSTGLWCPEFLLGFHYAIMIDKIISHMIQLNFQTPFTPQELDCSKYNSNHIADLLGNQAQS